MAKKGENIYLRKDGRWEGRYIKGRRPDGKPKFGSVYGRKYTDVKRRLGMVKAELCREHPDVFLYGDGSFRDWTEYWLEVLVRPHVKQGTYAGYRRNIEKHLYPSLGSQPVRFLSSGQIQDLVNEKKEELAAGTLQGICRLLKSILAAAQNKKVIPQNPCCEMKVPRAGRRNPRVLSREEQQKLERAAEKSGEWEYLLCLYTGLRVGELCALRWSDINFETHTLHVSHSVSRVPVERETRKTRLILTTPKSDTSIREIPLSPFVSSFLKQKKETARSEFLFEGARGQCRDPRTMQLGIVRLCKSLDIRGIHMHTLRHTFATRCLEQNIHYEVLSEFLGHSSPQITLRHYAHCTPETKRRCMERLDSAFSGRETL